MELAWNLELGTRVFKIGEKFGDWDIEMSYTRLPLVIVPSNIYYIHIEDELGNRQMAISHEAAARHAGADPDLRSAVYEDVEIVGCSFPEDGFSPSLPAAGGVRRRSRGR